jgi:hypothetical protein
MRIYRTIQKHWVKLPTEISSNSETHDNQYIPYLAGYILYLFVYFAFICRLYALNYDMHVDLDYKE